MAGQPVPLHGADHAADGPDPIPAGDVVQHFLIRGTEAVPLPDATNVAVVRDYTSEIVYSTVDAAPGWSLEYGGATEFPDHAYTDDCWRIIGPDTDYPGEDDWLIQLGFYVAKDTGEPDPADDIYLFAQLGSLSGNADNATRGNWCYPQVAGAWAGNFAFFDHCGHASTAYGVIVLPFSIRQVSGIDLSIANHSWVISGCRIK